jgi:hypothetical protein
MTKMILIDLGIGSPQNRSLTTKSIQQLLLSIRWWPAGSPTFAARPPVNASLSISSGEATRHCGNRFLTKRRDSFGKQLFFWSPTLKIFPLECMARNRISPSCPRYATCRAVEFIITVMTNTEDVNEAKKYPNRNPLQF